MIWLTLFLFVPAAIAGFIVAHRMRPVPLREGQSGAAWSQESEDRAAWRLGGKIVGFVATGLAILFLALSSLVAIDQGQVGVEVLFGRTTRSLDPGLQLKNPFASVVTYDTRPIETSYLSTSLEGDRLWEDAIVAFSKENATITANLTILWHIDPTMAQTVYALGGRNQDLVKEIVLRPVTRSRVRDCIGMFRFEDARTSMIDQVEACMVERMSADLAYRGIIIEEVLLRTLAATPELQGSIEQKLQAEQDVQRAEFQRQQALVDKQTAIIQAEAQAEVIRIEAQANADANDLEGASLRRNPTILSLRIVEALGEHSVVLLPTEGGVQPIIPLPE